MAAIFYQALLISTLSWALWKVLRRFFVKSALDNIPGPPSQSFSKGVFAQVFDANGWDFHKNMAEKYGGVIKIKAMFGENQLYVFDPKAMHQILVKDQNIFEETSAIITNNQLFVGPGLLGTLGEQHRKQRKMLNPVFSVNHMREMVPTLHDISHKVRTAFAARVKDGPREIDVLSWMGRTALELIAQTGLGYSFDPLTEDAVPHRYITAAKRLVPALFKVIFLQMYFLDFSSRIGTAKFRRFVINILPWKTLHDLRDIADVLHETSVEIIEGKRKALAAGDEAVAQQIGHGKDILSILLRANMETTSEEDRMSDEEVYGQVSTLTFAAMDTISSAISRTLWLLSQHQDVQDKLRQEVNDAKVDDSDLAYDDLVSLPYMDAVCREVLRLYPPISSVLRTTRQDVVMHLGTPIRGLDGHEVHEILIPNNTNMIVGIRAANIDPNIWGPDSYEWKPERWLVGLPESVSAAHVPGVYSNMMTFLGGGRACIGFKFSLLEMKAVLSVLITSFKFSPSDKEIAWQMNNIALPTVVGEGRPQLPLVLELAK